MEKNNLGKIILKVFKTYYPKQKINLKEENINNILEKININKDNIKKNELSKIIQIIKHHIELSKNKNEYNKNEYNKNEYNKNEYNKNFKQMENEDSFLDKQRIEYFDNIKKLRDDEGKNVYNQMDILPQNLRIKELMNEEYNEFEHYVIIDSKDRDLTVYPKPNEYTISLGVTSLSKNEKKGYIVRNYENVVSVELIQFILKDTRSVNNASDNPKIPPYILLEIEELSNIYEGTNNNINRAFARLIYYDLLDDNKDKYRVYTIDDMCKKIFKPRKTLNKLSIKIRNFTGELYSFGDGNDSASIMMNSFTLKITTYQKNLTTNFISKSN